MPSRKKPLAKAPRTSARMSPKVRVGVAGLPARDAAPIAIQHPAHPRERVESVRQHSHGADEQARREFDDEIDPCQKRGDLQSACCSTVKVLGVCH